MAQKPKTALPALGSIVQYDETITHELRHPITDEGLGVHFTLTSSGSDAVRAVVKRQMRASVASRSNQNALNVDTAVKMTEERLAASIVSWDFGGRELIEGQGVPECTHENKLILVRVDWIFDQISKQVNNLENFTKG